MKTPKIAKSVMLQSTSLVNCMAIKGISKIVDAKTKIIIT